MLFFSGARRRRERRNVVAAVREAARKLDDPERSGGLRFTKPIRSDEDRAHDTMFTLQDGPCRLSFVLDTRRARLRWWVLFERYAADGRTRIERAEAEFAGTELPGDAIAALLAAARGDRAIAAAKESAVDPFEPVPSDPPSQA